MRQPTQAVQELLRYTTEVHTLTMFHLEILWILKKNTSLHGADPCERLHHHLENGSEESGTIAVHITPGSKATKTHRPSQQTCRHILKQQSFPKFYPYIIYNYPNIIFGSSLILDHVQHLLLDDKK